MSKQKAKRPQITLFCNAGKDSTIDTGGTAVSVAVERPGEKEMWVQTRSAGGDGFTVWASRPAKNIISVANGETVRIAVHKTGSQLLVVHVVEHNNGTASYTAKEHRGRPCASMLATIRPRVKRTKAASSEAGASVAA